MTGPSNSYVDLSVLEAVREHVISPRAALIFSNDLQNILWANGEGANLLGVAAAGGAVSELATSQRSTIRQIEMATDQLDGSGVASAAMRLRSGFKTRLIAFTVSRIALNASTNAILLVSDDLHGRGFKPLKAAHSLAIALGKDSQGAAVVDSNGALIAASDNFTDRSISKVELAKWAKEIKSEKDFLIKRPLETNNGPLPAGMAYLSEQDGLSLIVLAKPDPKGKQSISAPIADVKPKAKAKPADADAATPGVGAFSSKRVKPGENKLGRWYYKESAKPDNSEPAKAVETNETAKISDEPVSAKSDKTPKATQEPTGKDETRTESKASKKRPSRLISSKKPVLKKPVLRKVVKKPTQAAKSNLKRPTDGSNVKQGGLIQTTKHTPVTKVADIAPDSLNTSDDTPIDDGFRFTSGSKPVRFVWEMDASTLFTSSTSEFAEAVGPKSANITGLTWNEVCTVFDLKERDEIASVLEQGDTWSGKTVLWPVQGTDLRVPIDFAGLPSYGRNRDFAGFNGFGIVRTADAVVYDDEQDGRSADLSQSENSAITPPKNATDKTLSDDEKETFNEIGETLSVDKGKAKGAKIPVTQIEAQSEIESESNSTGTSAEEVVIPSAFVSKSKSKSTDDVDTSILSRLPIPVLVYRDEDLLFANREFFNLTGYSDLDELAAKGGVDCLFDSKSEVDSDDTARIKHQDGSSIVVHANLQRVPWDKDRAMLLTLRRDGPDDGGTRRPTDDPEKGSNGAVSIDRPTDSSQTNSRELSQSGNSSNAVHSNIAANKVVPLRPAPQISQGEFGGLNNDELRNVLDTASDGVVVISKAGDIKALNRSAEALFDVDSTSLAGDDFSKLFARESQKSVASYLEAISGTGVASLLNDGREVMGITSDGGMIPLSMTIGQLQDGDTYCAIFRDMTPWKKVEGELIAAKQEAEQSSSKKSDFLAKVSHEVRTPLNAIIGFSEIMIEERFGKLNNERYSDYVRDINRSGNHVLELINDLLDISKIEAGEIELNFEECDLNTIVSETVALSQPQANKQRVIIRTSLSAVVPHVVADARSLRQIILNLVTNGIKFTKSGGQVIVSTVYDENGEVVLRVRDTGIGMSKDDVETAMKPFSQLQTLPNTNATGTGLGLPLTKALVEANRAKFQLESEPEEGTLIEVYFPSQRVLADR